MRIRFCRTMRTMLALLFLVASAPTAEASGPPAQPQQSTAPPAGIGRRIALVVGNAAYQHTAALTNPANDAADVAAALRDLGFTVIDGIDVTKRDLELKVREFAGALVDADTALFFYAGHGLRVGDANYLVSVDARLASERDLDFDAVRVDFVLRQMEIDREQKTNIVFLDACRDNPLSKNLARTMGTRSAAVGQGLAQIKSGVGTFISFSTQPGNVALDGQGRNSPFTAALVKNIHTPGRTLTGLMTEVRRDVLSATGGRQVPWDHSALTGEFYFVPPATSAPAVQGPPPAAGDAKAVAALQERMKQLEDELKARTAGGRPGPQRADQRYTLRRNNGIEGVVLEETTIPTFVGCTARCDGTKDCVGFQHNDASQACRLFSRVDRRDEVQGWNSGVRFSASQ